MDGTSLVLLILSFGLLTLVQVSVIYLYFRNRYKVFSEELDKKYDDLRAQISYMEGVSSSTLPIAIWVKDRYGVVRWVNHFYEKIFLIPRGYTRSDYIGHEDGAVWDKDTAKRFTDHDLIVLRTQQTIEFIEPVPNNQGMLKPWLVVKYPKYVDNVLVGVGGFAYDLKRVSEWKDILLSDTY